MTIAALDVDRATPARRRLATIVTKIAERQVEFLLINDLISMVKQIIRANAGALKLWLWLGIPY